MRLLKGWVSSRGSVVVKSTETDLWTVQLITHFDVTSKSTKQRSSQCKVKQIPALLLFLLFATLPIDRTLRRQTQLRNFLPTPASKSIKVGEHRPHRHHLHPP